MSKPLTAADREYVSWLGDTERRVILPLKWVLLLLCAMYWMWVRQWSMPSTGAFGLFVIFGAFTAGEQYFFARDRITPSQVRPFVYASFLFDCLFVAGAVLLDHLDTVMLVDQPLVSDFAFLYVLLILRGFALFRTKAENIYGFGSVSLLFLATAWVQLGQLDVLSYLPAVSRLGFLWGMIIVTQAFVGFVNQQKETELRARERQIRSLSLASLGELSAGVAHEINNPIGIIKTYTEYLLQSTTKENPLHEDFQTIRDEAERCQEIVRRMLDFSNPQVGEFVSIDVAATVRDVAQFVFLEGREDSIHVEVRVEELPPPVRGDPVQLKQAFVNVLVNARQILADFAEREDKAEDYQPRVEVVVGRATGPRPPVRIAVLDNGPGISAADAEKVFEPFFTRRRKGTGLGLAITRRIIEAHNGIIRLAPRPEGGTAAIIELPIEGEEKD